MTLTITHSHEEGTLIAGTAKGDGTAEALKQNRWRWGRSISSWYIPHSRDKNAKTRQITQTAQALEAVGFTVEILIDNTARPAEEVEADKAARAEDRAQALAAKADRKQAAAEQAQAASDGALNRLPEGGEPIKVGHHSERRHRRDIDRAHRAMGKSIEAQNEATRAAARATTASRAIENRYEPTTVANRIDRLVAESRKIERQLDGYTAQRGTPYAEQIPPATGFARERLYAELARVAGEHSYWRKVRDQQIASGEVVEYTRESFSAGDYVKAGRSGWWQVKRVNPKTLTLVAHGCSIKAPYGQITGHKTASEIPEGA